MQINARDEIDVCQVGSARNAFKELENRRDGSSIVNKPRVNKIADPKQIMEARRQKTYGDGSEVFCSLFFFFVKVQHTVIRISSK